MKTSLKLLIAALLVGLAVPLVSLVLLSFEENSPANDVLVIGGTVVAAALLAASVIAWRRDRMPK
jgi:protein-S-isoprenylcysteine O-methyltransferase Ste14